MQEDFNFYIPLQKAIGDTLVGVASTISPDRDFEKMSENALNEMAKEIISNGVNLFGNHEHSWENTLGVIRKAKVQNNQLLIEVKTDDPLQNPKVGLLLSKLKRGIKLGLSVGGAVTKEREEYDKTLGKKIKVIDGVRLYEISVVGIPSNSDSFVSLPQAIAKSRKEICPCCHSRMYKSKCDLCFYS